MSAHVGDLDNKISMGENVVGSLHDPLGMRKRELHKAFCNRIGN